MLVAAGSAVDAKVTAGHIQICYNKERRVRCINLIKNEHQFDLNFCAQGNV
jgi:hypothetical protein